MPQSGAAKICKQNKHYRKMNKKPSSRTDITKRSKNEAVKSAVGSYLKRRNFTNSDTFHKVELQLCQTSQQMAISSAIENDMTCSNSILYSPINGDISHIDQQFTKLKTWVADLRAVECRSELLTLLPPLLCHLYLEMLRIGSRQLAAKFLKRYQTILVSENSSSGGIGELLEELARVSSAQDIENRPLIKAFRSSKYQLRLSLKSLACLRKYLAVHGHVVLFQVLQSWFDLDVCTMTNGMSRLSDEDVPENSDSNDLESTQQANTSSSEQANLGNEVAGMTQGIGSSSADDRLRALQEAIRLLRKEPPPPTPLLLYTIQNAGNSVCCARVSWSRRILATGCNTSEVRIYRLPGSPNLGAARDVPHNNPVAHVRLACDDDEKVQNCRVTFEGNEVAVLRGHCRPVHDIALVTEANALVSVSGDGTMRAWRLADCSCAAVYRGHNYPIYSVDTSSLGVYVASASYDRTARLWSLDRTFCLRTFAGHTQELNAVKFHPNGSYLATASADKTVRLWSVGDSKMMRVFPGHKGGVHALAFSPDGKLIASAGEDKRVRIWDLAEGKILAELKGHSEPVLGLTWSPKGSVLVSSSTDSTVRQWNLEHSLGGEGRTPEVLSCGLDFSALVSLQYTQRNTLVCVGTA